MTYTIKLCIILISKKNFLGRIIKILRKGGSHRIIFLYEVTIVVLIYFIAILATPGIFLIQIVDTNVYLINFYGKNNIKMHFPKSWVLKFQNRFRHSLSIVTPWNKLRWQEKSHLNKVQEPNFQKRKIKYINFTYNVIFWRFF